MKKICAVTMAVIMVLAMPLVTIASESAIPVREFFESEGAQVEWNQAISQINITLDGNTARIYIDNNLLYVNNMAVAPLNSPIVLSDDISYINIYDAQRILHILANAQYVSGAPQIQFVPRTLQPITYAHGVIAYRYLEFIEENLPARIPFTQRERDAAEWIAAELVRMGHDPANITIQEFPITGMMPMILDMLNIGEGLEPVEEIPPMVQGMLASQNIYSMDDILAMEFLDGSQNVILTVPGQSSRRIIVGAHYDSPNSAGISDNASGTVTLMESAQRLLHLDHYYTITYIFFGAEEMGLLGAVYYVESLSEEALDDIVLMINIDVIFDGFDLTFGIGYHDFAAQTEGSNHVTQYIIDLANTLNEIYGLELIHEQYGIYLSSDQLVFMQAGFTVLTFYSVVNFTPNPWAMGMVSDGNYEFDPLITSERVELFLAMLDETEDDDILAAIEYDWEMIEILKFALAPLTSDFIFEQVEFIQELIASSTDEEFITALYDEIEMIKLLLPIFDHPAFAYFAAEVIAYMEASGMFGITTHTPESFMTPERLDLILAMFEGDDDPDVLAAIEYDRDALDIILFRLYMLTPEILNEQIEMFELSVDYSEDDDFLTFILAEIEAIETMIFLMEHPEFDNFMNTYEFPEELARVIAGDYTMGRMGLVLHTVNDNMAFLRENHPGLMERALEAYLIFLEAVLTSPAGYLE